jgi:catechol 2,3-dioxygenase-like lactoylglutathione lyase family enzyme
MPPLPESAVPILPSSDLARSEAFYAYLGFRVLSRTQDYLRVLHGTIELHLFLADDLDPLRNSAGCYFRVADPESLRRTWRRDGVACLEVPESDGYGLTRFALVDPDGNVLRYGPAEPAML